jgi:hypothetical protein
MPTERTQPEVAKAIRSIWAALLSPQWTRDDLIELGTHIFAKIPIERVDQTTIGRMLPKLKVVAEHLLDDLQTPPTEASGCECPTGPKNDEGPKGAP